MEKINTVDEDIRVDQKINKYRKIVIYFSIFYIIIDVVLCILTYTTSFAYLVFSLIDIAFFGIFIYGLNKKKVGIVEVVFFLCCIVLVLKGVSVIIYFLNLFWADLITNTIGFAIYAVFVYYIWEVRKYLIIDEGKRYNNRNNNTKPENIV